MDRLTGWDNGHAYFTECFEEPCLGMGCVNEDCDFKFLTCQRLAKYEDIGLTPEQLLEVDKLYAEKCREVAELQRYKWIPVEERLPEERDTVLISTDTGTYAGTYFCDEWYRENMYCYDSMLRETGVIAWMPMPEPYKPE